MTYLFIVIILSSINHLLFKLFARLNVNLLNAIFVNYGVCICVGVLAISERGSVGEFFYQSWFPISLIQGFLLVMSLFLMGWTTESQGVAVASLASRLSVAIPTIAAFVLYGDALTLSKMFGILAAILALYLSCIKTSVNQDTARAWKALPVVLFVTFGLHSTTMKYVQERHLDVESYHLYVMASFTFAFLMAGVFLLWKTLMGKQGFQRRDLVLGCVLGVSNYGAIYYLIRTLGVQGWQSSQLFPTISVAVVGLSTLGARVIFSETLSWRVIGALVVGAGSIVLVNLN